MVVSFLVYCRLKHDCSHALVCSPDTNLTAPNHQPTTNQERNDHCDNQNYSREPLMMGIVVPEAC